MYDYTGNNWSHWNSNEKLKKNLEAVPGKHSIDSLQKTAILGTSHIIRKVLQCEAWSLSGGDHRWFKRSTRKKRPVTRDDSTRSSSSNSSSSNSSSSNSSSSSSSSSNQLRKFTPCILSQVVSARWFDGRAISANRIYRISLKFYPLILKVIILLHETCAWHRTDSIKILRFRHEMLTHA